MNQQTELIRHWELKGYFVINLIATNKNGIPDLVATKPNECIYIESKESNDRLSPNQINRLNQLTLEGFECYVNYDKWKVTKEFDTDLF